MLALAGINEVTLLVTSLLIASAFVCAAYITYWIVQRFAPQAIGRTRRPPVNLDPLVAALTNSVYQTTAGGEVQEFFDLDAVTMIEPHATNITEFFVSRINSTIQSHEPGISWKVCFIEKDSGPVGALAFKALIERHLGMPTSVIRVRRRLDSAAIKGNAISKGDFVILVSDVITTGFQLMLACEKLRNMGAKVTHCFAMVDRRKTVGELEKQGYVIETLTSLDKLQSALDKRKGAA